MSASFRGAGNLGSDPELKWVDVSGEKTAVCSLRIYFDRPTPQKDGNYEDKGGFWMPVTIWRHRAESACRTLRKGMRVWVEGQLSQETWEDSESGETRTTMRVTADSISLDLGRVEQVTLMRRNR